MDETVESLCWNSDDPIRFNIDEDLVDEKCFNDDNKPLRLWDRSHAIKNVGKKVFDISESYLMGHIIWDIYPKKENQ